MLKFNLFRSFNSKTSQDFCVGKTILSDKNGRMCFIKNERYLNGIKHYTLSIQNEPNKRKILLSEQVVKREFRVI